jgi:chemosensory pili system protein ChpA (sensor histidine kinase/response regulator)
MRPVVVVKDADGTQAVVVDALLSGRDLVIKHLGRYLAGARGVVGASLLGDGRVLPVLDMQELLRLRRGGASIARPQFARAQPTATARPTLTNILVVDDSLSVRQALTQLLEDDGYQVTTAKDGIEALECFAKEMPAAVLVDLEMPRMNGLELTQRLRGNDATRHLPVIMVTSRTSDKHRTQAQLAGVDVYLTKPYREGDLLARLRSMLSKAA